MKEILMLASDPLPFGNSQKVGLDVSLGEPETQRFQSLQLLLSVPNSSHPLPIPQTIEGACQPIPT